MIWNKMDPAKDFNLEFRAFDRVSFEKSWEWLNDPEIKYLTVTPDFDRESQEVWFQGLSGMNDYYIRSVWCNNESIAVCGLKHITAIDGEVWEYIGEKRYWQKGIGSKMLQHLIEYAKTRNLQSIYCRLLEQNVNSLKMFRKHGFVVEKELGEGMILMRYNLMDE